MTKDMPLSFASGIATGIVMSSIAFVATKAFSSWMDKRAAIKEKKKKCRTYTL